MGGLFVVIEGIDGAGKTLHSKLLQKALEREGFAAVYTAEPSEGPVGRLLRDFSLKGVKLPPEVETLLFAADRLQHVESAILPNLREGKIVICDRYLHASLAYQGAQSVDLKWIREVNKFAVKPDLAIYLDVTAEVGLSRISKRRKSVFEKIDMERKVREIYLELVKSGELVLVDAERPVNEVHEELKELVMKEASSSRERAR